MAETATVPSYDALCKHLKELDSLESVAQLLEWDEMVMMPQGGTALRGVQKAAMAGITHDRQTDKTLGELLDKLADEQALNDVQKCVVREAKRKYDRETRISKEQTQRQKELQTQCYEAWHKARTEKDFSIFAPKLGEIAALQREIFAAVDPSKDVYSVALDTHEKGMSSARIAEIFGELKEKIPPLIAVVRASPNKPEADWMLGDYDTAKQAALCETVCKELGFDIASGRLDVSVHPFTVGVGPKDVRITTRFKADNLMEGLTGAIHECGHAMYEQGLNTSSAVDGTPVNKALSMGMHESQSLFWERNVALSLPFASLLLPKLQAAFPGFGDGKTPHDLYSGMNKMSDPSMVRVESDELTYPMHIILRYEIEKGLLEGTLPVEDVPKVWNEKMQEYLGCTPKDDVEGCLQDIHWSFGAFGYFPTYTLGAAFAVQLCRQVEKDLPSMHADIESGNFTPIRDWLREKVHQRGSMPTCSDELLQTVTGEPLNVSYFVDYLVQKYTSLYKL